MAYPLVLHSSSNIRDFSKYFSKVSYELLTCLSYKIFTIGESSFFFFILNSSGVIQKITLEILTNKSFKYFVIILFYILLLYKSFIEFLH